MKKTVTTVLLIVATMVSILTAVAPAKAFAANYCTECETQLNADEKFCQGCGTKIGTQVQTQNNVNNSVHNDNSFSTQLNEDEQTELREEVVLKACFIGALFFLVGLALTKYGVRANYKLLEVLGGIAWIIGTILITIPLYILCIRSL